MKLDKVMRTVDLHLGGESYRFITEGLPPLRGETMAEKMKYMSNNYDYFRTAVMCAPRGYRDMFGAVVTEPVSDNAHCGAFYMGAITENNYYPMAGTGTIALATMLVNMGRVPVCEPVTKVIIDTPLGQVNCNVNVKDGNVVKATYTNVPSFIYRKGVDINTEASGKVKVDIGYGGGNFCVFVDTEEIGTRLHRETINEMINPALEIIDKVKQKVELRHPEKNDMDVIDGCMYCDWVKDAGRELLILGKGLVSRCPCGTATSVRMIREYDRGRLEFGEEFIEKSMIGTSLKGRLIRKTMVGNLKAYIAEITGNAYMTGVHEFIFENDDPFKEGYTMEGGQKNGF